MFLRPFHTPLHEGANGSRGSVQNCHTVLRDDAPESVRFRKIGRAFVHQAGSAIREGAINHIAMSRYPAYVRSAPVDVFRFQVKNVFGSHLGVEQITASRMQNALWLPGGAARV